MRGYVGGGEDRIKRAEKSDSATRRDKPKDTSERDLKLPTQGQGIHAKGEIPK